MRKLELNAVLAGLRLLQEVRSNGTLPDEIFKLLEGDEPLTTGMLTNEQIDTLCESLNLAEYHVLAVGKPFGGWKFIGPFRSYDDSENYSVRFRYEREDTHTVLIEEPEPEETN